MIRHCHPDNRGRSGLPLTIKLKIWGRLFVTFGVLIVVGRTLCGSLVVVCTGMMLLHVQVCYKVPKGGHTLRVFVQVGTCAVVEQCTEKPILGWRGVCTCIALVPKSAIR